MTTFLLVLAAVNPPVVAVALGRGFRGRVVAVGAVVAWIVAVVVALASDAVLDALDVSRPTFQIAAGVVLGLASARLLIAGAHVEQHDDSAPGWREALAPVLLPVLLTPQLVAVVIASASDVGVAGPAVAAAISLALAWVAVVARVRTVVWAAAGRFVAALGVAMALGLAVDGVKSV